MIVHQTAALKIFSEVWSQYQALLESDIADPSVLEFILDVEYQIRQLFPCNGSFSRVLGQLIADPCAKNLRTTRSALGVAFLDKQIWPVKNYFSNGK